MSTLITIIIAILIVGLVCYVVNSFLPIDQNFKNLINIVAIIGLVIWILIKLTGYGFNF